MMKTSFKTQWPKVLLLLWTTVFVAFLYTFLHESGHALVGMLSGGTITAFNTSFWNLDAHVQFTGSLTPAQAVLNNLAGVGLPLLVWLVFMLAVPKRANIALEYLKVASTMMFPSTLLAWVLLPILYLAGQAPSDDVTNFLNNSALPPLLVTAAALLLFGGCWLLFLSRIDGWRREVSLFTSAGSEGVGPSARKTMYGMLGLLSVCVLVTFGANGFRRTTPAADPYAPPQGYTLVQQIDLSEKALDAEPVYSFTLDQKAKVGVFLLVERINSDYFEVRLTGPQAYELLIIHAEGYTAVKDIPHVEETLHPGQYHCIITSRSSAGLLSIYTLGTE